jgi:fibronectin-binding autotransporter adhesin
MADTITGTSTTQVTLSGAADNPATIVGTAVLDLGLYASNLSGLAWTITNAGQILDGGITLASTGTVANAGGIANASGAGVTLDAGGSVTNQSGGTISGRTGIHAVFAATVMNAEVVAGDTATSLDRGISCWLAAASPISVTERSAAMSGLTPRGRRPWSTPA